MDDTSPPLVVEDLSFKYRARDEWALQHVSFSMDRGELLLLAGASGCGKTTISRCINGLIPRSYRGEMQGSVKVNGREVREMGLAEVAQVVGTLLQNPDRQIVASTVEGEVAFGPENLGLPRDEIFQRVDEVLDRLKLDHLRGRETYALSGGERQKVALAGVLAMRPSILLLDEPLASLDPAAAQEALALFRRLVDEGVTVIVVEHRVEDVLGMRPDRVMYVSKGIVEYLGPTEGLYEVVNPKEVKLPAEVVMAKARKVGPGAQVAPTPRHEPGANLVQFEDVEYAYGDGPTVLHHVNLSVRKGDVVAVLGPNGAGKSTLVKHAIGLLKPKSGRVLVEGKDTRELTVAETAHTVGYVFQSPTHMLFAPTVQEELAFGPKNLGYDSEAIQASSSRSVRALNLTGLEEFPPLSLSYGQQKRLTIACVVAMMSKILAMDEPTAGQDFGNYTSFMNAIVKGSTNGSDSSSAGDSVASAFDAVLFITHDLDLAVLYASKVILLSEGSVVAEGPPEDVLHDVDLLRACHVVPTSLLKENLRLLDKTGRFLPAENLAFVE